MYVSIYAGMYVYMYVWMYTCMYVWKHIHIYIYICVYIYIYICIYIYIYIYILKWSCQGAWAQIPINLPSVCARTPPKSCVFRWEVLTFSKIGDTPIRVDQPQCHTSGAKSILFFLENSTLPSKNTTFIIFSNDPVKELELRYLLIRCRCAPGRHLKVIILDGRSQLFRK